MVQPIEFVSEDSASDGTMTMTWKVTPSTPDHELKIRADDAWRSGVVDERSVAMYRQLAGRGPRGPQQ